MLDSKIVEAYSKVHVPVHASRDESISFEGSQRGIEFFTAWDSISEYYKKNKVKELTFLEVGAWKGLWGLAFAEFCKLHNIKGKYVTITLINHDHEANKFLPNVITYIKDQGFEAELIDINTLSPEALPAVLEHGSMYDIVFIDAGHKYHEIKNDIDKFAPLAKDLLLFHDIRPIEDSGNCGVYRAITDSGIQLDEEIAFTNEMGIGIKYIK